MPPLRVSAKPSSDSEQIMPAEAWPRMRPFLIVTPPGRLWPSRATGTSWPAATLGAPQTMASGSPPPTSTVQQER